MLQVALPARFPGWVCQIGPSSGHAYPLTGLQSLGLSCSACKAMPHEAVKQTCDICSADNKE